MSLNGLVFPPELYYLIEHQVWARLDDDGCATIGITALGIRHSGEIYMCRPKRIGTALAQGESMAVVELSKSVVAVKSPVSGTIVAVNERLEDAPELVHRDPYGAGWIARLRLTDFAADRVALLHGAPVTDAMARHARLHRQDWLPVTSSKPEP